MAKLDDLFDGQVGEFWSLDDDFEPGVVMRGFIQRNDVGLIVVNTIDEGSADFRAWDREDRRVTPRCVAGLTEETGVVLLRPTGSSAKKNYGGHRASTRQFRFRTVAAEVWARDLRTGKVDELEVRFADMLRWAQMPAMQTEQETHEDGRLKTVTIKLDAKGRCDTVRLYDAIKLHIKPYWSYTSNDAYSRIETPLAVSVESSRPRLIEELIEPVTDFKLLLSLAHGALIDCDSARVQMHYGKREDGKWSPVWDQQLMESQGRPGKTPLPKFSYQHLGEASGVARWLKFSRTHARFIRPVTMHPMRPGMIVTTRLMELYAAFEYYVAVSRQQKAPWAPRGNLPEARILAEHGGPEFAQLVGDPIRWADMVHWMNNRVKHNPVDPDPLDVHWLNESAEALISIIALNHASRRKYASKSFVADHRTERVGREVRSVLKRYPDPLPKKY